MRSQYSRLTSKQRVLIIGGGFAGLEVIRRLNKKYEVILIDVKTFFEYTPSILECLCNPKKLDSLIFNFEKIKSKYHFTFLHAKLISLSVAETTATLLHPDQSKTLVQFDFCVITAGSGQNAPIKPSLNDFTSLDQRKKQIYDSHRAICSAKSILVIGGGIVGVELVCELGVHFKDKNIAIQARRTILPSMPKRARTLALQRMQQLKIIVKEKKTEKDQSYDLVFECTGNKFPTLLIKCEEKGKNQEESKINVEAKQVKVDDYLRVLKDQEFSIQNVFAAGDIAISPINEEKVCI